MFFFINMLCVWYLYIHLGAFLDGIRENLVTREKYQKDR